MGGDGVEPSTSSLSEKRSTDELATQIVKLEARTGLEPVHDCFANSCVNRFTTAPHRAKYIKIEADLKGYL